MFKMNVQVDISGLKDVQKELDKTLKDVNTVEGVLDREVLGLERTIKETAPVDTGRYRAAWMADKKRGAGFIEWFLSNNVFYSVYLVFGTRKRGILHNVRGLFESWNMGLNDRLKRHFK